MVEPIGDWLSARNSGTPPCCRHVGDDFSVGVRRSEHVSLRKEKKCYYIIFYHCDGSGRLSLSCHKKPSLEV